ncbi:hypothetical protein K9M59_00300 [Candidatus Gracilibacteria bacterium]|nr:hypothetical protein [Candidatus Gracilibacteria bacterium]MCF7819023.1 hypothetical protein [Candidatus Gracilibacteria bacterium]
MIPAQIQKWLKSDNFPQRVLLSGGNIGKEIALEIAAQLQKTTPEKIKKGIYSDVLFFPDTGKSFKIDWSDAAKKDEQSEYENVRGLIRWSHQKPNEGTYRIVILENIERLSRESPHALLKLIEEPPLKTIFLFTTRNHHQLLETVLSRVTIVRLPTQDKDFEVSEDIKNFFEGKSLIPKFQKIDELDKASKDNKDKKIDRRVFLSFLEDLIRYIRLFRKYQEHMGILFETHQAIGQNINPRLCLERLAVKITG